ncbi:MAG: DMT family transporter [Proteobacteria bacterium]|nr:DMT family transporter [Pseudomonadota bacterium]
MPADALALVLVAALLHATWNLVAKKAGGNHHFVFACALAVGLLWLPAALWVGVGEVAQWPPLAWAAVLGSAVVHLAYFSALLKGYRVADLTVVYPVARGTGPLLSALGAVLLLGEALTPSGVLGLAGIVTGIVLLAAGPTLWRPVHDREVAARRLRGLRWGLLTGALIAGYTVIDGYAIKVLLLSPVLIDYFGNLLRIPFQAPLIWRDRAGFVPALRTQWRHVLVVAALGPLAYILVLYAMRLAPLSHVAPAREVSMLVAAVLGGQLLGERDRGWRLLGAACVTAGVVLLAW